LSREEIRTERLLLRPFRDADLAGLHAMHSLEEVARHLYWEPRSEEETRRVLARKMERPALVTDGECLDYAVELRATGALVGDVSLILRSRAHRQGEIGYVFHPDHAGNGYATEASRALLALGFADLDLHRLIGRLEAANGASARVLERLGMRREAHLVENEWVKGEWQSEIVYAMLQAEWRGMARQDPVQA
jgi:RimJ/RimL family protein N-acetyltransferase